jgi:hypothetical protein
MPDDEELRQEIYTALQASSAAAEVDHATACLELEVLVESAQGRYQPINIEIIEWAAA